MIRQSLPFFANFRRQLIQTCYMLEGGGEGGSRALDMW